MSHVPLPQLHHHIQQLRKNQLHLILTHCPPPLHHLTQTHPQPLLYQVNKRTILINLIQRYKLRQPNKQLLVLYLVYRSLLRQLFILYQ